MFCEVYDTDSDVKHRKGRSKLYATIAMEIQDIFLFHWMHLALIPKCVCHREHINNHLSLSLPSKGLPLYCQMYIV